MSLHQMTRFPFSTDYISELSTNPETISIINDNIKSMIEEVAMSSESDYLWDQMIRADHFGCYCQFANNFITEEMQADFSYIAKAFLAHERNNLDKYNDISYIDDSCTSSSPSEHYSFQILSLMINALQQKNEFTCQLFVTLYKAYYKKEFKLLKRFHSINARELISIVDEKPYFDTMYEMARILCMCEAMNIEIMPNCDIIYNKLNKFHKDWKQIYEKDTKPLTVPKEMFIDCLNWIEEQNKTIKILDEVEQAQEYKSFYYADEICKMSFLNNGFTDDFLYVNMKTSIPLKYLMAYVKAMLKIRYPTVEVTFEELQQLAIINLVVNSYCSCVNKTNEFVNNLLGFYSDEFCPEEHIWNDTMIPANKIQRPQDPLPPTITSVPVTNTGNTSSKRDTSNDTDLSHEIDELRNKLHQKEMAYDHLKQLYNSSRNSQKELSARLTTYEDEHREVIALREHIFHTTEEDITIESTSLLAMKSAIHKKQIIIIGGHTNWTNRLHTLFPNWKFINVKISKSIDPSIVKGADYVYFFTDYIKHASYYKFIHTIREQHVPFGYINNTNIDKNINQIYTNVILSR